MRPVLEPESELDSPSPSDDEAPVEPVGLAVGVRTLVTTTVTKPVDPEETLVATEVKGEGVAVVDTDSAVAVGSREPAEDAASEDSGADVREGELPPPPPLVAIPVIVERVGTVSASSEPTVA
jgi:hypothetical protein